MRALRTTQATRDWLVMELDDIRLDDNVFQELMYSCDLEPHWRPQARAPAALRDRSVSLMRAEDVLEGAGIMALLQFWCNTMPVFIPAFAW